MLSPFTETFLFLFFFLSFFLLLLLLLSFFSFFFFFLFFFFLSNWDVLLSVIWSIFVCHGQRQLLSTLNCRGDVSVASVVVESSISFVST